MHILYVDDVSINLRVFHGLLKPTGAKVVLRQNGKDALELLNKQKDCDLIFLDHLMPEMDGVMLYKEIRKLGITVPIFILTANADKSYVDLYRETGFAAKIDKPVQAGELYMSHGDGVQGSYFMIREQRLSCHYISDSH